MSDSGNCRFPNDGRHRKEAVTVAAVHLAGGSTHKQAAGRAGVSERTLRYWLRQPAFVDRVETIRSQMVSQAIGKVSKQLAKNIDRLSKIARSDDERAAVAATKALLDHWKTLRESGELSDQVKELLGRDGSGGAK